MSQTKCVLQNLNDLGKINNTPRLDAVDKMIQWGSTTVQERTDGRGGVQNPEIPKAFQNRAQLNPIVKTVKNC